MPVYEYQCQKCEKHFEYEHGVNDPQPETCEECGGELKKVFVPVGIVFKGSGFYINDSRKKENGAAECGEKKSEPAAPACSTCSENSSCSTNNSSESE